MWGGVRVRGVAKVCVYTMPLECERPVALLWKAAEMVRSTLGSDCFFFHDTATTGIYTLSLHDALPISLLWKASEMFRSPLESDWARPPVPRKVCG